MPTSPFPMRVVWDPSVVHQPLRPFVDDAIKHFAVTGKPQPHVQAHFVDSDVGDPDEQGVILTIVDPYNASDGFRAYLKFVVDEGANAILVWSVERI